MNDYIKAREDYINFVKKELLGPGSEINIPDEEHELISSDPTQRYSIGILFTRGYTQKFDNNDIEDDEHFDLFEEFKDDESSEDDILTSEKKYDNFSESENQFTENIIDDGMDEDIRLSSQYKPSSMGFTFFVTGATDKINCRIKFATYRKSLSTDCKLPLHDIVNLDDFKIPAKLSDYIIFDKEKNLLSLAKGGFTSKLVSECKNEISDKEILNCFYRLASLLRGYVREPQECNVTLDFTKAKKGYVEQLLCIDGLKLKVTALKRNFEKCTSITMMLVNDHEYSRQPEKMIFQPEISVKSDDNDFVFAEASFANNFNLLNSEDKNLEMLYRNKKNYGTGLGTSVNWNINNDGIGFIKTDYFPEIEVAGLDFDLPYEYQIEESALSMKYLSDLNNAEKDEKIKNLRSINSAYEKWINKLEKRSQVLDEKYSDSAQTNIRICKETLNRIEDGLNILKSNDAAWNSFQLANRAMFMQRAHIKFQENTANIDRFYDDEEIEKEVYEIDYFEIDNNNLFKDGFKWRLFQIAFMLLSIKSIVEDASVDRELVDLIWFPTGGGKTEAYLGLSAFTIFYRRLIHKEKAGGTTIIMRYTLRLLAAQQFTRASTLICACEYIRVDATSKCPIYGKYDLGNEPISIGLWIGSKHTPNTNIDAKYHFNQLSAAKDFNLRIAKENHNKFQVLKCPWCGTKLVKEVVNGKLKGIWGYRMPSSHFEVFCPQQSCFFNGEGKLPIQIVDEELYKNPPTLLFSTVDKFAMLPWKSQVKSFFGFEKNNRPPELIIQDVYLLFPTY